MSAAVNPDGTAKAVRFLVNRPVPLIAEISLDTGGWQHRAAHAQFVDNPAQLLDSGRGFLEWNQTHRLKARIFFHVGMVNPIVVGARHIDWIHHTYMKKNPRFKAMG